jgi:integrase
VAPSKLTVAEHVRARLTQWQAAGEMSPNTYERYGHLIENQIVPHLGAKLVQKLKTADVEQWHRTLQTKGRKDGDGGISARTIRHAHRVLSKALSDAVRFDIVTRNVTGRDGQRAPRVASEEVEADKIGDVLTKLRGHAIYPKAVTALFTGLRRGELLAVRWSRVDLDAKMLGVHETLEETKAGIRFKVPKTRAGRRDISLPDAVVDVLREQRRQQMEQRMALGLGKLPDDALVFPALGGGPSRPTNLSSGWADVAEAIGLPGVTFHALRHTHASMLINAGLDVVRISKRLGHENPSITLKVYAHLFEKRGDKSAEAINAAVSALGKM